MAWHFKAILCYNMVMLLFTTFLFLDKVWEFDNHTECFLENQGKLGNMAKYYDCTAFGKLSSYYKLCFSKQNVYKLCTHLKYNYSGKNPDGFYAQREQF